MAIFSRGLRAALTGVLACLVPLSEPGAQPPSRPLAAVGAWVLDCTPEPTTGEKWCQVGTSLESLQPPYSLQFNYIRDSRMFFAMGSPRFSKVQVRVDSHRPYDLERCLGGMCLIKGETARLLLEEMRGGTTLVLEFEGRQLPGPLSVGLAGFDDLYRRALGVRR